MNREESKRCVGAGWGKLLDEFYDLLPADAKIISVKEKYGGLRIDGFGYSSELGQALEEKSNLICEICGERGETRDLPWILTLCDKHYKEKLNDKIQNSIT